MIKVGCCGFAVSKKIYFKHLSLVEIQQTFYQPPKLETGRKWREEAPENFEFTLKAWQLITHDPSSPTYRRLKIKIKEEQKKNYGFFKNTDEVKEAWQATKEFAKALGTKIIVFQCPASFTPSDENVKNIKSFFNRIDRDGLIFIWEPRGQWGMDQIERICKELELSPCIDIFNSNPPKGDLLYLRLHGKTGYRYKYSNDDLIKIKRIAELYPQSYILFNNIYMYEDSLKMVKILNKD